MQFVMEHLEHRELYSVAHVVAAKVAQATKTKTSPSSTLPVGVWQGTGTGKYLVVGPGESQLLKKKLKVHVTITISATGNPNQPIQGIVSDQIITGSFDYYELPGTVTAAGAGKSTVSMSGNNYIYGGIVNPTLVGGSAVSLGGAVSNNKTMTGNYALYVNKVETFEVTKFSVKKVGG